MANMTVGVVVSKKINDSKEYEWQRTTGGLAQAGVCSRLTTGR